MSLAEEFAWRLLAWHARSGRHDLPWQIAWRQRRDPYVIWLAEVMLQQTQVATVIPYYQRFLERFPQLADLAAAPQADVMACWSGLGYYARGRNLHRAAQVVMSRHGGRFPQEVAEIAALPGIGRSTAHAIAACCFGARLPILDGNVKRVLCRVFAIDGPPATAAVESRLWQHAEILIASVPPADVPAFLQAQMDLGASLCASRRPDCPPCPLAAICKAYRAGRQNELPTPKPRRAIPLREACFLVITDGHQVLMETRADTGLWGGLQTLPELPPGQAVENILASRGLTLRRAVTELPAVTHTFSHFRLNIRPLICEVAAAPAVMEPGCQWLPLSAIANAALPAPVRRILQAVPELQ